MKHLIYTLLFVFLLLSCNDSQQEQPATPNIVLILTDNQMKLKPGDNLSSMEYGIETREPAYYHFDQ